MKTSNPGLSRLICLFILAVAVQASPLPQIVEATLFNARWEVEKRQRNYENLAHIFHYGLNPEAAAYFQGRADAYSDVLENVLSESGVTTFSAQP
jgi:hypothetical protein